MFRQLKRDLDAVVERDPAARTRWEVGLLYPGVHAVWTHRASHWLWQHGAKFPARALSQASRAMTGIEIHPGARIGDGLVIDHGSGVVIGETAEVGEDVTIYHGVTLGGTSLQRGVKRHPTVGDRVTIGAGAKVLGPVTVGSDSRLGANAVLVRSVPEGSVVVGVPGQVISSRRPTAVRTAADSPADPVGATVKALLSRVERLETRLDAATEDEPVRMRAVGEWEWSDYSI